MNEEHISRRRKPIVGGVNGAVGMAIPWCIANCSGFFVLMAFVLV